MLRDSRSRPFFVMAGHSASKDARKRAYAPAIHVFDAVGKSWMPATRVYTRAGRRPDPGAGHDVLRVTADTSLACASHGSSRCLRSPLAFWDCAARDAPGWPTGVARR